MLKDIKFYKIKIIFASIFILTTFSVVSAAISICPGQPLNLRWTPTNAATCKGSWTYGGSPDTKGYTSYPIITNPGSKSFGDTSLWPTGNYGVKYQCSNINGEAAPESSDTVTLRNDAGCYCGSKSSASLCYCNANEDKKTHSDTTYYCPPGRVSEGTGSSMTCRYTKWVSSGCTGGGGGGGGGAPVQEAKRNILYSFFNKAKANTLAACTRTPIYYYEPALQETTNYYYCEAKAAQPSVNLEFK